MTALTDFQRLEAPGVWRPSSGSPLAEVIVSVGEATLAIYDVNETPLTHWSLPAIERRNRGEMPAIYAPGPDATETLEIDDEMMVTAIEQVRRVVVRKRPQNGKFRTSVRAGIALALVVAGALWLPGALTRHAADMARPSMRADIGARLLLEMSRQAGGPCRMPSALPALSSLAARVLQDPDGQVAVLRNGPSDGAVVLPGNIVVLSSDLVTTRTDPAVAAGHLIAAEVSAEETSPMETLMRSAGPFAAASLLTRGTLPDAAFAEAADEFLSAAPNSTNTEALAAAFAQARVDPAPYASVTGGVSPAAPAETASVLSEDEWAALRGICAD